MEPKELPNRKLTPLKFNMEPENNGFQIRLSFSRDLFSGSMLNFGGVYKTILGSRGFVKRNRALKVGSKGSASQNKTKKARLRKFQYHR